MPGADGTRDLVFEPSHPPVLQKLNLLMRTRLLRPKVIVEYDRTPFVEKLGNTRITFDRNIRSSNAVQSFLEREIPGRPILPAGKQILEVKYDEFLRIICIGTCSFPICGRQLFRNIISADAFPLPDPRLKGYLYLKPE